MPISRGRFVTLAAAAPLLANCSGSQGRGVNVAPVPQVTPSAVPPLAAGQSIPDLRFGFSPTPTPFPGYDPVGDATALFVPGTPSAAQSPVPGTLATGSYGANERYVIKVPSAWNGKLIVAGTPSFRSEFANDFIWGDMALALGYAFASSNKTVQFNAIAETVTVTPSPSTFFPIPFNLSGLETLKYGYRFGALTQSPLPLISAWNLDFAQLTVAAQSYLAQRFGQHPTRTYAVGLSNGGAQVRSLLENWGNLVDGGVDWSGVFWSPSSNILTYLPQFLANMPAYVASGFNDPVSAAAIQAAGYPADLKQSSVAHPSLWFDYYGGATSFYSDLTLFAYALLLDATASSYTQAAGCVPNAGNPVRLPGTCSASGLAVPANRAAYVQSNAAAQTIATFSHTGNIAKPLVSIAGGADMFITANNNAYPYLRAVQSSGQGSKYWQYLVSGGTHVDTFVSNGYGLRAQLPFAWAAFQQMVSVVERGYNPPGSGTQQGVSNPAQITAM